MNAASVSETLFPWELHSKQISRMMFFITLSACVLPAIAQLRLTGCHGNNNHVTIKLLNAAPPTTLLRLSPIYCVRSHQGY